MTDYMLSPVSLPIESLNLGVVWVTPTHYPNSTDKRSRKKNEMKNGRFSGRVLNQCLLNE